MTLMEALHEARFLDLTLPIGAHPMLKSVVYWMQESPRSVKELYDAAGMPPPAQFGGVAVEDVKQEAAIDVRLSTGSSVHSEKFPIKLYRLMSDGKPRSIAQIMSALAPCTREVVNTSINRWRNKGVNIVSEFTRDTRDTGDTEKKRERLYLYRMILRKDQPSE